LDPRFDDAQYRRALDANALEKLRQWSQENQGELLKPTGKNMRNLNPVFRSAHAWDLGWWGYLVNGAPARFASINTRSERLGASRAPLPERAIVPATYWREMQKPSRIWHNFALPGEELLGLAAVTRPGFTADGSEFTCYSIVMHESHASITEIHDRMPLLIPADFAEDWLTSDAAAGEVIDAAVAASQAVAARVTVQAQPAAAPPSTLF